MTAPRRTPSSRSPAGRAATRPKGPTGRVGARTGLTAAGPDGPQVPAVIDVTDTQVATPADVAAAPRPQRATAPDSARRNRITGRAAVLLLVLAMLGVAYAWPLREYYNQRAQIRDLRTATRATAARVIALEAEKARWADPAYIEAQARGRLHYVMPGEVAFTVIHPNQPNLVQTLPHTPPPVRAWYDALWGSVRGADDPAATESTP
jgi:cell division protein FtsB